MKNTSALAIAIAFAIVIFTTVFAVTDGFKGAELVSSTDTTVRSGTPTANNDITEGFLPGYVWVDQAGGDAYIAIDTSDGAAVWAQVTN